MLYANNFFGVAGIQSASSGPEVRYKVCLIMVRITVLYHLLYIYLLITSYEVREWKQVVQDNTNLIVFI